MSLCSCSDPCVNGHHRQQSVVQPTKVVSPARGQLKRENCLSPVSVRRLRPASSRSFSTLGLNLVLTHGISPAFSDGFHLFIPSTAIGSVPSLYQVSHILRTDGVHCREFASTGPVVLKVVPVTGAAFSGIPVHGPIFVRLSLPTPMYLPAIRQII